MHLEGLFMLIFRLLKKKKNLKNLAKTEKLFKKHLIK